MSKERPIAYEPHPVSPERKAELRKQGFKIIDARFDPNPKTGDGLRDDGPTVAEYVAAGYRAEHYPPQGFACRSTPEEIAKAIAEQANVGGEQLSDEELRAAIEAATGQKPHHFTGREKLLEQFNSLGEVTKEGGE